MIRIPEPTKISRAIVACFLVLWALSAALAQEPAERMKFIVSMDQPNAHYFHVVFRATGLKGETQDLKMPSWTPGYYQIMDYARNVLNFKAEDGAGRPLSWRKTAKNVWRVEAGKSSSIIVSYDIYAFRRFCADSYLDDRQGFICPAGVFMHVAGQLGQSVTVTFRPFATWTQISTGLDRVEGVPDTFFAPDFDVLYDCPILIGNQEVLSFEVRGIPHQVAAVDLGACDRGQLVRDLTRIIGSAATLMGSIPYKHYTFIFIGPGRGGLEHANSSVLAFDGEGLASPEGWKRWLAFICHEYFHLYNVKRIRPVALGPFDYDKENYTDMLWVSEGFTVYYEGLILNRAGLFSRDDVFRQFESSIAAFENVPGRLFQSVAASSFDTWLQSFIRTGNAANTTISYYDKGAALGLLLDLAIRNASKNVRSLDDVMRTLYQGFLRDRRRGFTDDGFRRACEEAAGMPLTEVFDYVSTVREIDYPKYFAYAGLHIDTEPKVVPGAWFGASTSEEEGRLVVTGVEWDSPASHAGLSVEDEIIAVDGTRIDARSLTDLLQRKKPGDTSHLLVSRHSMVREFPIVWGTKKARTFAITPLPDPKPLQAAILKSWLREN
jgi:predicted metalloprotease with PDZ domain